MIFRLDTDNPYEKIINCELNDERWKPGGGIKDRYKPQGPMPTGSKSLHPLNKYHLPRGILWRDRNGRQIPDMVDAQYRVYSERMVETVQSVEADCGEWLPLDFTYSRGGKVETYYHAVDLPAVDILDEVASNMFITAGGIYITASNARILKRPIPAHADPDKGSQVVLRANVTTPPVFRIAGLNEVTIYATDEMRKAFEDRGIFGVKFTPMLASEESARS